MDDLSVSTIILSTQRQAVEHLLVGHHRRLVGPGPARPALGYATVTTEKDFATTSTGHLIIMLISI